MYTLIFSHVKHNEDDFQVQMLKIMVKMHQAQEISPTIVVRS